MPETTVYYDNGGNVPSVVRFSGRLQTSLIRSSTDITGLPTSVEGISIDDSNYVLGCSSIDEIWYMSGQYTSVILNSISQSLIQGSILSLSLDTDNTATKANMTGTIALALFSGKVTSTVLATWDPDNQNVYPGSLAPKCLVTVMEDAVLKPVFYISNSDANNGPIYVRLTSFFSTVIADVEAAFSVRDISGKVVTYYGVKLQWLGTGASSQQAILTGYFLPIVVHLADLIRPPHVTAGSGSDIDNDNLLERLTEIRQESVTQEITFTHQVDTPEIFFESITQFIVFGFSVFGGTWQLLHDLELTDEVSYAGSIFQRILSHDMDLTDVVGIVIIQNVPAQTITFSQVVEVVFQGIAENTLIITDNLIGIIVDFNFDDTILFSQDVSTSSDQSESISQTLAFGHVLAAWLAGTSDCIYDPQPTRPIPFAITTRANVTLKDNLSPPVHTVTIRNPGFGNSESIEVFRAFNTSRHRTRSLFRDNDWPKTKSINIVSSENTQAESLDMLSFLSNTLGQEITLIDWENRTWIGIVLNPESAVRDLGNCRYRFDIDFIGRLRETDASIFNENLSHTLIMTQVNVGIIFCTQNCGGSGIPIGFPSSQPI